MTRGCIVEGCERKHHARGYCSAHYSLKLRTGDVANLPPVPPPTPLCTIEGCSRAHKARGMCAMHYYRWRVIGNVSKGRSVQEDTDPREMSGQRRAEFGVIVSFETLSGDQRITLHRVGPTKAAIRDACDAAERYDEDYRVVAISTPASVYSDLLQRLPNLGRGGKGRANGIVQAPEAQMLTLAGRRHMLHPSLDRKNRAVFVDDDTWEPRPFA